MGEGDGRGEVDHRGWVGGGSVCPDVQRVTIVATLSTSLATLRMASILMGNVILNMTTVTLIVMWLLQCLSGNTLLTNLMLMLCQSVDTKPGVY